MMMPVLYVFTNCLIGDRLRAPRKARSATSPRASLSAAPTRSASPSVRHSAPLGPYSRTIPRALWWSLGGGATPYTLHPPRRHPPVRDRRPPLRSLYTLTPHPTPYTRRQTPCVCVCVCVRVCMKERERESVFVFPDGIPQCGTDALRFALYTPCTLRV